MGDAPSLQRQENTVAPSDGQAAVKPEHHALLDDMPLFLRAVAYSGLQTPINGLAQIADHFGANIQSHVQFVSAAEGGNSFLDKAQVMAGSAIGMIVPYAIGGAVSKKLLGIGAGEEAVARLGSGAFSLSVKEAALTGGLTGLVLQPGQEGPGQNFWASRAYNGLSGAATFSLMSASALKMKGWSETVPLFKSEAVVSAVAGLPAGALNVQMDSLLQNHKFAPLGQTLESAATMSILGGAFGAVHDARGAYTNYYATDARTTPRLPADQADLRVTSRPAVPPTLVDFTAGGGVRTFESAPQVSSEAAVKIIPVEPANQVPINAMPLEVAPNQPINPAMLQVAPPEVPGIEAQSAPINPNAPRIDAFDNTLTSFLPRRTVDLGGQAIPQDAKYFRVGRTDISLRPGGPPAVIGREQIGTAQVWGTAAENPGGHAQVGLTAKGEPYLTAGWPQANDTYIKRKGATEWTRLPDLPQQPNGGVIVRYGDQVRLGRQGEANLDLSEITAARFKIGKTDVTLMPGERKLLGREDIDSNDLTISRKHLNVGLDTSGRAYIYEDPAHPSSFGTFIKRQGAADFTRVVPGAEVHVFPGDDVRFGALKPDSPAAYPFANRPLDLSNMYGEINDAATPELTTWGRFKQSLFGSKEITADAAGTVIRSKDGGLRYRDGRGLIEEDANGSKTITDYSGAVMREWSGKIINMTDANGAQFRYQYGNDGKIAKVFFGDVAYPQTPGMNWSLERDGSLHLTQDQGNGYRQETIYRPDGSQDSASVTPGSAPRYTTRNINIRAEETRIVQQSEVMLPPEDQPRFNGMLSQLKTSGLTAEQQGQVLHQLNRLLSEDATAVLKPSERAVLAQQTLQQVLDPSVIDQGSPSRSRNLKARSTCTVAALEKKVAFENPAEYVRIIADTASSGTYVNADGKRLDLVETGVPQIDDQAAADLLRGLPNPFKGVGDRNRTWASKIFQQSALNLLLDEREAGAVRYVDRGDHEAQVHASNLRGRTMLVNGLGGRMEPLHNPNILYGSDLETMYQKMTGKQENFWITADVSGTKDVPVRVGHEIIGGAADLGLKLQQMQAKGIHAIADIDVRNNPFWETSGHGAAGGAGGSGDRGLQARRHAVFVKDIELQYLRNGDGSVRYDTRTGQPIVDIFNSKVTMLNSWGRAADHVRANVFKGGQDTRLSLQQLYDSMNGWRPGKP